MTLLEEGLPTPVSQRMACDVLAICRNTFRQACQQQQFCGPPKPAHRSPQPSQQPRALSGAERQQVLATLTSETYCNQPPAEVYYSLLEQGDYLCSISSMHRILRAEQLQGERRPQRPPQSHAIPRLKATAPHEVWTWDIAKLATQKRGEYLSLYVVMDLFSRYIVAWMLSRKENSALASQLMLEASQRYAIRENTLTLHQDRGAPMTAHCYLDLLSELAITASHSRPRVSNDNPMSEAQFKTLKYQPDYPRRFDGYDHAQRWCQDYVHWYNTGHHHSALAGFTPQQVFTGDYQVLAEARQQVMDQAYRQHPERFAAGRPIIKMPPEVVYINPIPEDADEATTDSGVNFPTLKRLRANAI
ncbi:MAG: IS3 family transposase [Thiothrix sp.]